MEEILFKSPWAPYNDQLFHSRIALTYPRNLIFTVQFVNKMVTSDIYQKYPEAEKINLPSLQDIDWQQSIIVFNSDLKLLLAPDPVHKLMQLHRRLHFDAAADRIFGPFRFLPSFFETFRFQMVGIVLIMLCRVAIVWLGGKYDNANALTLSNTSSTAPRDQDP